MSRLPISSRIALLAGIAGLAAAVQAAEFDPPIAIRGATVITEPGQQIENGAIVMREGRIESVGANAAIPSDAVVIDGAGLYVYPGFIDAASHIGMPEKVFDASELDRIGDVEKDEVQAPLTSMRHANRKGVWPHHSPIDAYTVEEKALEKYREAGFTTALVVPRPAILGGSGDLISLSDAPLRRATIAASVVQIANLDAPGEVPGFERLDYPVSALGAFALVRQTFLDADWYADILRIAERRGDRAPRPLRDPVLEAVLKLKENDTLVLFEANESDRILHALSLAEELDLRPAILGGKEAWKVADRLAEDGVPVIVSLDWPEKPKLAPKKKDEKEGAVFTTAAWQPDWENEFFEPLRVRRERVRLWEEQVNNAARLMAAGVNVAFTAYDQKEPSKFKEKLKEALEHELEPDQALAALTKNAAEIFGAANSAGVIAEGAAANLTILNKPFGEEKAKVRYVFVDGEHFAYSLPGEDKKKDEEEDDEDTGESGDDAESEGEEESDDKEGEEDKEDEEEENPSDNYPWASELEADRVPSIQTGGDVLLRNARVITVTNGTLDNADVLIRDGRIKSVGTGLTAPNGVRVIDLTGYWVMPGIVDPHSHMAIRAVNEFSDSVTAEVQIADVVNHTDRAIWRALAGGVTTIHTMHGSANTIGGQNAVLKLKYNTSPEEMLFEEGPPIVKFALGENVIRANFGEWRGKRFPISRMGVESVVRQAFNDAIQYRQQLEDRTPRGAFPPRPDMRLNALNAILAGDIWVHSHCYRADEILRLLDVAEDYGVRIATLQHVLEGYRVMPEMLRHGVAGSTFSDWWAYKLEAFDAIPYNAAMMYNHGIVSSLNSDDDGVARHLYLEAGKSMRFGGLSADEALELITINPARQIGRDEWVGSIEEGKWGDIAVFDAHPLDTFSKTVLTLVEGEVFFQHPDFVEREGPGTAWVPEPPRGPLDIAVNASGAYVIRGATVHPISGPPIDNGVVVVQDGRITGVGSQTDAPADATVIDAAGLHVYPGIINAATDLALAEIGRIPAVSDRTEIADFQPEVRAISAVNPFSSHINVTRCEGITTAAVLPDGGYVSGQVGLVQLGGWSMPEMLREKALGLVVDLPTLPVELDEEKRDDQIKEQRERWEDIERFFREAKHYHEVHRKAGEDNDLVRDVRLEAMGPYLDGEAPVFFRAQSLKQILQALNFAGEFNLRPIIVGGKDAWKCVDQLKAKNVPVIINSVLAYPDDPFEPFNATYANAGKLAEAGVPFAFGIVNDGYAFAKQLPVNAGFAVAHGLPEDDALHALTLGAAEILGVEDQIGSIEIGKVADLIISTGHPCQASSRTVGVFLAGKPADLASKHEEHYHKWNNRPEPNLPPAPEDLNGPPPMRLSRF